MTLSLVKSCIEPLAGSMVAPGVSLKFTGICFGNMGFERTVNVMFVSAELMFSLRISAVW